MNSYPLKDLVESLGLNIQLSAIERSIHTAEERKLGRFYDGDTEIPCRTDAEWDAVIKGSISALKAKYNDLAVRQKEEFYAGMKKSFQNSFKKDGTMAYNTVLSKLKKAA
jgi:hypothetical protein